MLDRIDVENDPVNWVDPWGVLRSGRNDPNKTKRNHVTLKAPCPERQPCYDRALERFLRFNTGVTLTQLTCAAIGGLESGGVAALAAFKACGIVFAPMRGIALGRYRLDIKICDEEIPCCE